MDIKEFILAKCLKGQSDIEIITEKDYISQPKPKCAKTPAGKSAARRSSASLISRTVWSTSA